MASGISEECRDCWGCGRYFCEECPDGGFCPVCEDTGFIDCPTCGATGYVEVEA